MLGPALLEHFRCQPGVADGLAPGLAGSAARDRPNIPERALESVLAELSWSEALELSGCWQQWCEVRLQEEGLRRCLAEIRSRERRNCALRQLRSLGAPYALLLRLFGVSRRQLQSLGLCVAPPGGRPRQLRCDELLAVASALERLEIPSGRLPATVGEWLCLARLTAPVPLGATYARLVREGRKW